jgi:fructose-1,6-bisphosphatase/inositol monophosphatase family enzyme
LMTLHEQLRELHFRIYNQVRNAVRTQQADNAQVVAADHGDVTYGIDARAEKIIHEYFSSHPPDGGAVVVCEGIGRRTYPETLMEEQAKYSIIIDPLDGTREIMYDKRSCWILTGVALNRGRSTCLSDIFFALQTEVPPMIQRHSTVLYAERGKGAWSSVWDIDRREQLSQPAHMIPSGAADLKHGFAVFVNFFPGMKEIISQLEERVLFKLLGSPEENKALTFTDQYITTAGQIYLLASGKYRFVADFRAALGETTAASGQKLTLCCHPYDLSTWLIIEEAGGTITDAKGGVLSYPLDTDTNCSWLGYANTKLRGSIEPVILSELAKLPQEALLKKAGHRIGISRRDELMDTGEYRFRLTLNDGSGYICCLAPPSGLWQNAHYHKKLSETFAVQKGKALFVHLLDNEYHCQLIRAGEAITINPLTHHNVYMYPDTITHTIKYGDCMDGDWYPCRNTDAWCKKLDVNSFADQ